MQATAATSVSSKLESIMAHNMEILVLMRLLNIRSGRDTFPVPDQAELTELLETCLGGARRLAEVRDLEVLRLPEPDPEIVADILRKNPNTLCVLGSDLPVTYSEFADPSVTLTPDMVNSGRWRELQDEGYKTPGGKPVRVVVDASTYRDVGDVSIPHLKRLLEVCFPDRDALSWMPSTAPRRYREDDWDERGRLGRTAQEAIERVFGACPLCGASLYGDACRAWHDPRRILFQEPSRPILTLFTDSGQEVAQLIVHKSGGHVSVSRSASLRGYSWGGRPFAETEVRKYEGLIIPASVKDLDGCCMDIDDLKAWQVEVVTKKTAAAEHVRLVGRNEIARLTCKAGSGGRIVAEHRGMEYSVPYEAFPYPDAGTTWFFRLSDAMQRKPTALPLYMQAPSSRDEEEFLAELVGKFLNKYGFLPLGF